MQLRGSRPLWDMPRRFAGSQSLTPNRLCARFQISPLKELTFGQDENVASNLLSFLSISKDL